MRAGKRKATVTMVRPETTRSECKVYLGGVSQRTSSKIPRD